MLAETIHGWIPEDRNFPPSLSILRILLFAHLRGLTFVRAGSQVISFVEESFHGSIMREKQNAKMRFEFPQQAQHTLADLFGFLEVRQPAAHVVSCVISV